MVNDHQNGNDAGIPAQTEQEKIAAFRLAAIIEYSNDAIVSKTVDGIVIGWNHGAERLYGYMAEEMIGHPIAVLYPPDQYPEYLRIMTLVSTHVRNGAFSGTFCRTLDFVNARFLAKNHAVLKYPSTCVDTNGS